MQAKIFHVYSRIQPTGGAEKMLQQLHQKLATPLNCSSCIVGTNSNEEAAAILGLKASEYKKLSLRTLFEMRGHLVLSHHRKVTTLLVLANALLRLRLRLVHLAQNEFTSLKHLSLFPKHILSVSDSVKRNHVSYFGIPENNITVIYNATEDIYNTHPETRSADGKIVILYPARITSVKQQVECVRHLKGKLNGNIRLVFAGDGPQEEELRTICAEDPQFLVLGKVTDMNSKYKACDYVLLYSLKEGLPLSLTEAMMHAKPCIGSNIGGNADIITADSGYLPGSWEELIATLNNLPLPGTEEYIAKSKAARARFLDKFELNRHIDEYVEYLKVL